MSNPNDLFSEESLDRLFDHHAPKSDDVGAKHSYVRGHCKVLANALAVYCPPSAERTLALRKLEECMFWSNAAIARHQ